MPRKMPSEIVDIAYNALILYHSFGIIKENVNAYTKELISW